jgi:hypothetical protein
VYSSDLGKYKSVACLYCPATAEAAFRTLDTSRAELTRLIARTRPAVVVIEACTLSGWVHDLCGELGVPCRVANTAAEAWKYKHTKRKTDRDDALRLAQLQALGQLPEVEAGPRVAGPDRPPSGPRRSAGGRPEPGAILVGQGLPAPRGARAWTRLGRDGIAQYARPLTECGPDELWRGLLDLALTAYRQAEELAAVAEARLDAIGTADARVQLLDTVPALGALACRIGRTVYHLWRKQESFDAAKFLAS